MSTKFRTSLGSRTRSVTASCRPTCWARRITGTRPAHDTRFGSSKVARTTGASSVDSGKGTLRWKQRSDLTEIVFAGKGRGQFHDAGEDFAVPVAAGRWVEDVRVDQGRAGGGLLDTPIELDTRPGVLISLDDPGETTSTTRSTCSGRVGVTSMVSARYTVTSGRRLFRGTSCSRTSKSVSAFPSGPAAPSRAFARSISAVIPHPGIPPRSAGGRRR